MGEDIMYVLRDILDIGKVPSSIDEYTIYYPHSKSDSLRPSVLFDKSKLPAGTPVIIKYRKICENYRLVGLAIVKKFDSNGRPITGEVFENRLSYGGPFTLPGKSDKILDERIKF